MLLNSFLVWKCSVLTIVYEEQHSREVFCIIKRKREVCDKCLQ